MEYACFSSEHCTELDMAEYDGIENDNQQLSWINGCRGLMTKGFDCECNGNWDNLQKTA